MCPGILSGNRRESRVVLFVKSLNHTDCICRFLQMVRQQLQLQACDNIFLLYFISSNTHTTTSSLPTRTQPRIRKTHPRTFCTRIVMLNSYGQWKLQEFTSPTCFEGCLGQITRYFRFISATCLRSFRTVRATLRNPDGKHAPTKQVSGCDHCCILPSY